MTSTQIGFAVAGVLLVCWIVGAYNRMVRLRNDPGRALRRGRRALPRSATRCSSARSSCCRPLSPAPGRASTRCVPPAGRREAAREPMRGAARTLASAITSLRVADEILADARARLPVQTVPGNVLPAINAELANGDAALDFARREFNDAVADYNAAVRQFPTLLLARLFGFRAGATL